MTHISSIDQLQAKTVKVTVRTSLKSEENDGKEDELVTKVKLNPENAKIGLQNTKCEINSKRSPPKLRYGTWAYQSFTLNVGDFVEYSNCRANGMNDALALEKNLYPSLKMRTDKTLFFQEGLFFPNFVLVEHTDFFKYLEEPIPSSMNNEERMSFLGEKEDKPPGKKSKFYLSRISSFYQSKNYEYLIIDQNKKTFTNEISCSTKQIVYTTESKIIGLCRFPPIPETEQGKIPTNVPPMLFVQEINNEMLIKYLDGASFVKPNDAP